MTSAFPVSVRFSISNFIKKKKEDVYFPCRSFSLQGTGLDVTRTPKILKETSVLQTKKKTKFSLFDTIVYSI